MKAIMVATQHRGIFYGEVPEDYDLTQKTMRLENARCAIRFGTMKGVAHLLTWKRCMTLLLFGL